MKYSHLCILKRNDNLKQSVHSFLFLIFLLINSCILSPSNNDDNSVTPAPQQGNSSNDFCISCHGQDGPSTGLHQLHLKTPYTKKIDCVECHKLPDIKNISAHIDGIPGKLTWGKQASQHGKIPSWVAATKTCSNTYCHAGANGGTDQSPQWITGNGVTSCTTCHGDPPPAPHTQNTNCVGCHENTINPDGTLNIQDGFHLDGQIQMTGFSHTPTPTSCVACHESKRPVSPHPTGVDCVKCHNDPGGFWVNRKKFDHLPTPTSCSTCHENKRPIIPHPQGIDCIACHNDPGGFWANRKKYNHNPTPTSCVTCHEQKRPASPHPTNVDCVKCHTDPGGVWTTRKKFDHLPKPTSCVGCHEIIRPSTPHPQTGDCVSCHKNPGVSWKGVTNWNHLPTPNTCITCHENKRPVAPHPLSLDCVKCHSDPGGLWSNRKVFDHLPTPTSCSACHESKRPTTPHPQGIDCVQCHKDIGKTWTNNVFYDHNPKPTTCTSCHEKTRPTRISHTQRDDCLTCHTSPGVAWVGTGNVKQCVDCHSQKQGTRRQVTGSGGDFSLPSKHISGTVQTSDCQSCHDLSLHGSGTVKFINAQTGGSLSGNMNNFCINCHTNTPPQGVSFPVANGTGYDKSAFPTSMHKQNIGPSACLHCHNGHGSINKKLLKGNYATNDYTSYSVGDGKFNTCWNCHNESDLMNTNKPNAFEDLHNKHVRGEKAACITCHDVHKESIGTGGQGHIDFKYAIDHAFDFSLRSGVPLQQSYSNVDFIGNCTLNCHGKSHSPKSYISQPLNSSTCTKCHTSTPVVINNGDNVQKPIPLIQAFAKDLAKCTQSTFNDLSCLTP